MINRQAYNPVREMGSTSLSALRSELMQPEAYEAFQASFKKRLVQSQDSAEDTLRLLDARVREHETSHRNLLRAIETGDAVAVLLPRLSAVDAELKEIKLNREEIIPPAVGLPEKLPEPYRKKVAELLGALRDGAIRTRALEVLRGLIERVVVRHESSTLVLELEGAITAMIDQAQPVVLRGVDACSVEVVAGAGFEPATFRL